MLFLKQSTASQSVLIGPFVDDADGNTAETGLTISNTDIRLSKNGGNIAAKNSGGGTHDELGYYTITLDATDTDTVGRLQLMVHESGALPVYHEYQVLEESVYDDMFGSSADLTAAVARAILPQQNQAYNNIEFLMVDSTDHVTAKTGLTITATRSIDGGAFASATGTAAEVANGIYQFDASAADMNGTIITFRFTGTDADDTFVTVRTAA